ncbi:YifB family Mg chelatase-like AAA ATPase [Leucobacter sp. CSA1]|uniref:YifB family Mg chelatase-like AAA ATPase n=1 Tax=Leucobacter chromiisoli TaxID=2796471 RepID=A0A934Q8Z7_9MICO|nr:YifB family Mg chelatase-like AAA ATPase [Leucobacter chromiisoli]MBK0420071.1 YifB family Mg chelatase-like AAA ATPase [Leucobacter chromiisoli]
MSSPVCRAAAIALTGIEGTTVMVEAALSQQLPGMAIIGLPDAALAEAKLRVRTATAQASLPLADRFVLINLSPAALPKQGSGFDLAIALAALSASRHLPPGRLPGTAHIGELGLDGGLRRPTGLLSAVLAAKSLGFERVMVPAICSAEAALVPGIEVVAVRDLAGAVAWHRGDPADRAGWWLEPRPARSAPLARAEGSEPRGDPDREPAGAPDMADVIGQPEAVEALTVAAAGRHHVSLLGPPGAGKTLLATRLPSILPDLTTEESLLASSIASLGDSSLTRLVSRPPFESPHHTASAVAIIGGGDSSGVRPGAITRACHGVLFLDEAPELPRSVLDALRQPLESGVIEIHRSHLRATLPANVQLVIAANPCPCGNAGSPDTAEQCRCSPSVRVRYLQRISGPLSDRIDLRLTVRRVSTALLGESMPRRLGSRELRERVTLARDRAAARLTGTPWRVNGELPGTWLRGSAARLPRGDTAVLDRALSRGALTLRGYDRALRVAWTIADLEGKERPGRQELARALVLRGGAMP